jgi:carboxyl-terminal processing protease
MKRYYTTLFIGILVSFTAVAQAPLSPVQWEKINQALYYITHFYVDTVAEQQLVENAIVGMLDKLDPHSSYMSATESRRVSENMDGSFEGIGIQFQLLRDTIVVMQSMAGCPAEKVGIVIGDKIIAAGGQTIAGVKITTTEIQKLLRGKRGTKVDVTVVRTGVKKPIDFVITRDKIPIYSLETAYMITPKVGYIKINTFSRTTMNEYKAAFLKLKAQNMQQLILDLQSNSGGLMTAAVELVDEFLDDNKIIVYTKGEHTPNTSYHSTAHGDFEQGDLVVLVDEYSASASEIVAGALQDWERATIIGRRTFGKGLVQRDFPMEDGAVMRMVVARYFTPSGRNIQKPYHDGSEKYHQELQKRYQHGELQNEDSIVFPDSLKHKTLLLGRTVYGGGGIMPDVFVPFDTTLYTDYHRNIVAKGVMNRTVVEYLKAENTAIKRAYPTFEKFQDKFFTDNALLHALIENGTTSGVVFDETQYNRSKALIQRQMKALIARSVYENGDYYKIMNVEDPVIQKAIEILAGND